MGTVQIADKLGAPLLGFFFNRHWLVIGLILVLISPLLPMYVGKPFVDGVFPRWTDMWLSFQFDVAIAFAGMTLAWYCQTRLPDGFRLSAWLGYGMVALSVALGLFLGFRHMAAEKGAAVHSNPGAIYHNYFLYAVLPLAIGLPLIAVIVHMVRSPNWAAAAVLLVFVACIGGWVLAARYDDTHQYNAQGISKHQLAHRSDWRNWGEPGYFKHLWPSLRYAFGLPTDWSPHVVP